MLCHIYRRHIDLWFHALGNMQMLVIIGTTFEEILLLLLHIWFVTP